MKLTSRNFFFLAVSTLLVMTSCKILDKREKKDEGPLRVFINGKIYTGAPGKEWASVMVVEGKSFLYVGNDLPSAFSSVGSVVDLKGRTVIPGLYDSHIHPISAGEEKLYKCNFPQTASLKELLQTVDEYAGKAEGDFWITGGRWSADLLGQLDKAALDSVSHGHPIVLYDFSNHNIWANTLAIRKAGITKQMAVKKHGKLVGLNQDGSLSGVFIEEATGLFSGKIPPPSIQQLEKAFLASQEILHGYGIVGVKDSYVGDNEIQTYRGLDSLNKLKMHVAACIGWDLGPKGLTFEMQKMRFLRLFKDSSRHVDTRFAKITLDGIPPTKTAAMLEPYNPVEEKQKGKLLIAPKAFYRDVKWLDKMGITIKVHAVGDRAARTVLNAVEKAHEANGNSGLRHEIAHGCIISDKDMKRFGELNVVADMSPFFWYPSPIFSGIVKLLGKERAKNYCPVADLMKDGTYPTYGTDWPVAPSVNPWPAIEALVTRENPFGERKGEFAAPDQKITLKQALSMLTINGARAQRTEMKRGSIEEGKTADFIILNQNIFSVDVNEISETTVLQTYFEGEKVYQRKVNN
ncbi:MAG: amidohydrolase [Cytophagales bacterium]|nr:amidohydrolase [Cytophagales bacterium]